MPRFIALCFSCLGFVAVALAAPVTVSPVTAKHGMVVAGHPQAADAGLAVLKAGGNAVDAAVAASLALGVAEPYGSGLGGKLMLLYYEAKSGRTYAIDAMDAAGSLDVVAYLKRPEEDRSYGYGAVCVPGLGAGLWAAHQKWGTMEWARAVQPAIELARTGFRVLPKTRELFAEQEKKLRRGDREIARLYLPGGEVPRAGTLLPNPDLARTLEAFAKEGRDGFYRGAVAEAIVRASRARGGVLTLDDLAKYEARLSEPITMDFRGYTLLCSPPPTSGAALFLPIMKALERESFGGQPLHAAANLDLIGRVWRVVVPQVSRAVADVPESRFLVEKLMASDSIASIREKAFAAQQRRKTAALVPRWGGGESVAFAPAEDLAPAARQSGGQAGEFSVHEESPMASTTHYIVVDREGNIVCATQSLSLHFGAGVVPEGTGVVMNNTMSNFMYADAKSINFLAPGKRPRSTIAPTIVLRDRKPVFAIGLPGASRIPTALLQVLLDRLAFGRSLGDAIGDTRIHYYAPIRREEPETFEAEQSLPHADARELEARGWKVVLFEPAGTGRHFGGINAVEFNADGTRSGYADPRRTNAAVGH